jgi:hypothetical protein
VSAEGSAGAATTEGASAKRTPFGAGYEAAGVGAGDEAAGVGAGEGVEAGVFSIVCDSEPRSWDFRSRTRPSRGEWVAAV